MYGNDSTKLYLLNLFFTFPKEFKVSIVLKGFFKKECCSASVLHYIHRLQIGFV